MALVVQDDPARPAFRERMASLVGTEKTRSSEEIYEQFIEQSMKVMGASQP